MGLRVPNFSMPRFKVPTTFGEAKDFIKVKDSADNRRIDRWTNQDILPVLPKNRTFTTSAFVAYWVTGAVSASFWSKGGTFLANGLTAAESIGAVVVAVFICAIVAHACGEPGRKYHLGFPMLSRSVFGMYGSYIVVVLKCFTNCIYCGIQSYWGGLAVDVMLSAIFPSFHNMKNTLPERANITTDQLVGTIVYMVIFYAFLFIPPYNLHKFFRASFYMVLTTIIGMFIWAMGSNKGPGNLLSPAKSLSAADRAFVFLQSICVLCSAYTGASVRHADWSRYAKTPRAPWIGMWIASPVGLTLAATLGILVTSACRDMYGSVIWQPITLLLKIQEVNYNSATRAGTFFAGGGWFVSQLAINVSLNTVAAGMDLTSVLPQYIDSRRRSILLASIGFAVCPWNFVNSAATFTTVLSAIGLFLSPLTGMYMADFWIIRRRNWKVPDLYIGNKSSIYWFTGGFNLRAIACWFILIWMSLPGLAAAVRGENYGQSWKRIFDMTFLIGWIGGFIVYTAISLIFPPESARIHEDLLEDMPSLDESKDASVVEGQEVPDLEMANQVHPTPKKEGLS